MALAVKETAPPAVRLRSVVAVVVSVTMARASVTPTAALAAVAALPAVVGADPL